MGARDRCGRRALLSDPPNLLVATITRGREALTSALGAFWQATRGGALALGEARFGALEVGLEADMSLWRVPPWAETADALLGASSSITTHPGPRDLGTGKHGLSAI